MLPPQRHQILAGISEPSDVDVLVGRGSVVNMHEGNKAFREVIDLHRKSYIKPSKAQKSILAKCTVFYVRSLGGRFLEKDKSCGLWFEIGDRRAIEKVERALQERYKGTLAPQKKQQNKKIQACFTSSAKDCAINATIKPSQLSMVCLRSERALNQSELKDKAESKLAILDGESVDHEKVNFYDLSTFSHEGKRKLSSNILVEEEKLQEIRKRLSVAQSKLLDKNTGIASNILFDPQDEYVDVVGL